MLFWERRQFCWQRLSLSTHATRASTTADMKHNPAIRRPFGCSDVVIWVGMKSPKPTVVNVINQTYSPCQMFHSSSTIDMEAAMKIIVTKAMKLSNKSFNSKCDISVFFRMHFSNLVRRHLRRLLLPEPHDLRVRRIRGIPNRAYPMVTICPVKVRGEIFPYPGNKHKTKIWVKLKCVTKKKFSVSVHL